LDGQGFSDDTSQLARAPTAPDAPPVLYHDSWAVVVGIDNYTTWPKLRYAANDANGIKETLLTKFHFNPDHVFTLLNEDATREKILSVLGDTLSNPKNVQKDDRCLSSSQGTARRGSCRAAAISDTSSLWMPIRRISRENRFR
jgi:hypothetical protein